MLNIIKERPEKEVKGQKEYTICIGSLNRCVSEGIADANSLLGSIALSKDDNKVIMMVKRRPNSQISIPASQLAIRYMMHISECSEKPVLFELSKREFKTESECDDFIATLVNTLEILLSSKQCERITILIKDDIDSDEGEI